MWLQAYLRPLKALTTLLVVIFILGYPLLIYFGLTLVEPKYLVLLMASYYGYRAVTALTKRSTQAAVVILIAALAGGLWLVNRETPLRLLPTIISLVMASVFLVTLKIPPTLPARMALKEHGFLTEPMRAYTTKVTWLWIVFFLVNASIAAYSALYASREFWLLYNGLISYGLIGLLFATEFAYRKLIFFKQHNL